MTPPQERARASGRCNASTIRCTSIRYSSTRGPSGTSAATAQLAEPVPNVELGNPVTRSIPVLPDGDAHQPRSAANPRGVRNSRAASRGSGDHAVMCRARVLKPRASFDHVGHEPKARVAHPPRHLPTTLCRERHAAGLEPGPAISGRHVGAQRRSGSVEPLARDSQASGHHPPPRELHLNPTLRVDVVCAHSDHPMWP